MSKILFKKGDVISIKPKLPVPYLSVALQQVIGIVSKDQQRAGDYVYYDTVISEGLYAESERVKLVKMRPYTPKAVKVDIDKIIENICSDCDRCIDPWPEDQREILIRAGRRIEAGDTIFKRFGHGWWHHVGRGEYTPSNPVYSQRCRHRLYDQEADKVKSKRRVPVLSSTAWPIIKECLQALGYDDLSLQNIKSGSISFAVNAPVEVKLVSV